MGLASITSSVKIYFIVVAITQWISPQLPSCGPRFDSQAQHLRFFQLIFELRLEKDENKQKEVGIGPYLKKSILDQSR